MAKRSAVSAVMSAMWSGSVVSANALRSGHLGGAGLDVFDREPLPADHPFRSMDNVVVTPHVGYVTEQLFRANWKLMAEDVAAYLAGAPVRVVTDQADCPPMVPQ
jgi:phosphoglycerate dehydrogenase-like enzyme